jgi:hypothetical protein
MAPLRKQIEKYEEKLAKLKGRDDARATNAPYPTPAVDSGAEPHQVQKEAGSLAEAVERSRENAPNPPGDQAETHSTENSDGPKDEVESPPIAPAEVPPPQEVDPSMSAADAADEEALSAVVAVWRRASRRAHNRHIPFDTFADDADAEMNHITCGR